MPLLSSYAELAQILFTLLLIFEGWRISDTVANYTFFILLYYKMASSAVDEEAFLCSLNKNLWYNLNK